LRAGFKAPYLKRSWIRVWRYANRLVACSQSCEAIRPVGQRYLLFQ